MSFSKKVLIFTATYNESENIEELIYSIQNQGSLTDILIIDDKVKLLSMSLAGYKYINLKTDKEKNTQKIIKIWKKLVV